jgi:hypothetical protein
MTKALALDSGQQTAATRERTDSSLSSLEGLADVKDSPGEVDPIEDGNWPDSPALVSQTTLWTIIVVGQ